MGAGTGTVCLTAVSPYDAPVDMSTDFEFEEMEKAYGIVSG